MYSRGSRSYHVIGTTVRVALWHEPCSGSGRGLGSHDAFGVAAGPEVALEYQP